MGFRLHLDGELHEVTVARRHPTLVLTVDGKELEVAAPPGPGDGHGTMEIGGLEIAFARAAVGDRQIVRLDGRTFDVALVDPYSGGGAAGGAQDALKAPMPGAVVSVHRRPGETVLRGEPLITIESMKLQTALPAPRDGVVARIYRTEGETFEKDEVIATLEPQTEAA